MTTATTSIATSTSAAPVSARPGSDRLNPAARAATGSDEFALRGGRIAAIAAASLSAGFAVVHAAWATGWRWGVPTDTAPIVTRPLFLAYVVAAASVFAIGSVLALRLMAADHGRVGRWCRRLAVIGGAVAALRGLSGLVVDSIATLMGDVPTTVSVLADVWFIAIGISFGWAGLRLARR